MSFGPSQVSKLDFDFTSFPRNDGEPGKCTGKGVMPEPTEDLIKAFFEQVQELRGLGDLLKIDKDELASLSEEDRTAFLELRKQEIEEKFSAALPKTREAITTLGQGTPTVAELEQLPPRVMRAFSTWVLEELTDPKGSRSDTSL